MSSKYANYTKEELIEEQNLLRITTGEDIGGALGGLPVVEQTQEFFVVFDAHVQQVTTSSSLS